MTGRFNNIVILTGAGISAESGLDTFRGAGGLWRNHRVEEVASPGAYAANPALVLDFYNQRRARLLDRSVKPNAAHHALARLQETFPGPVTLVTQNIDDLHERSGSKEVIHMHGELLKMLCTHCNGVFMIRHDIKLEHKCANCGSVGTLRPDVVWFGEIPYHMEQITERLHRCDLFLSVGTSGSVYPAARFVSTANRAGAHSVEINLEPSLGESRFHEKIHGKAGEVLPEYIERLLQ